MASSDRSIVAELEHMQLVAYFEIVSVTIWLFDYFLTFDLEVSFIWGSPWNITRILFTLTRYLQFITTLVVMCSELLPGISMSACQISYKVTAWLMVIGMAIAEVILTIRTWALWGRDKRLTIALPIFYILCWTPVFAIMGVFLNSYYTMTLGRDLVPGFSGCFATARDPILVANWIIFMVYEAVLLALMAIQAIAAYRYGGNSALSTVVLRDGILYYIYLFILQAIEVLVIIALSHDFINLLVSLECVVHSVLASRVILHIREQANQNLSYRDGLTDNYTLGPNLQFASFHAASATGFKSEHGQRSLSQHHARARMCSPYRQTAKKICTPMVLNKCSGKMENGCGKITEARLLRSHDVVVCRQRQTYLPLKHFLGFAEFMIIDPNWPSSSAHGI